MRGFPKHIATAQDLKNVQDMFPKETTAYLQRLAEGRFIWQDAGVVGDKEIVQETDDLKVVESKTEAGVKCFGGKLTDYQAGGVGQIITTTTPKEIEPIK
jgi:hypothetical protein